jgi:dinuclear metal center YbgI/SA1388 family protein
MSYLEELWPVESADDWDRPGLSVGSREATVSSVLLSVDVTSAIVDEAIQVGANLILSHHPLLLRGVNDVSEQSLKGEIVTKAIKNDVAIYSAHTNADKAPTGTAAALAQLYGLTNLRVLDPETGHGLIGQLPEPMTLLQFSTKIAKLLPPVAAGIKVAGDHQAIVKTIALSPGAGDADLGKALAAQVDVFITSDLRHHPAQDFIETPGDRTRALIDVSHWASESIYLDKVAQLLLDKFPGLHVRVSEVRTDPWDFAVMQ